MSRAALKKELAGLTASQLVEVILDAYQARPEIKEYFEYYLNPDVGKLYDKYHKIVVKEFSRSKWHRSKARVSVVSKALKEFRSMSSDAEWQCRLLIDIIVIMGVTEVSVDLADRHWNLLDKIVVDLMSTADCAGLIGKVMEQLSIITSADYEHAALCFRRAVAEAVEKYDPQFVMRKK